MNYIVNRDKSNQIYVEEIKNTIKTGNGIIDAKSVMQTKYELFQGKDKNNRTLIGFAYLEIPEMGSSQLIIVNSKDCPIGYFDNFNHFTFYPLTEIDIKLSSLKRLDKPVEAIFQFVQILVDKNKI